MFNSRFAWRRSYVLCGFRVRGSRLVRMRSWPSTYTQIAGPLRAHGPCTTYLSVDPVNLMKHVTPHCAARSLPAGTHKCVNTLLQMRSPERSLGHSARGLAARLSCVLCCSALAGCAIFGLLYDRTLVYDFWLGMRLPP